MEFTYDAYFRFLKRLRAAGYEVRGFDGRTDRTQPRDQVLLLRHDVDLDLDRALALAKLEHQQGFSATYFILVTGPFYNPASAFSREQLRAIATLGHSIGLHFDASVYRCDSDLTEFNRRSSEEARQLEEISGVSVDAVSFHRPAPKLFGAGPELTAPRVHTYLPRFVREMEYCSDSTGVWLYGPPDQREAIARGEAMHLLTHAEWWGERSMPRSPRLSMLLQDRAEYEKRAVPEELGLPVPLNPSGADD